MIPKPSRKARLAAEKEARVAASLRRAELRHDVIVRARERCEWCLAPGAELHHILGGSGRRSQEERIDTLVLLCVACHHDVHRSNRTTLTVGLAWARRQGYAAARTELERRLAA